MNKLFSVAEQAVPIGGNRFYHRGWIVVVVGGVVKTTYRPKTLEHFNAIHAAMRKAK